MMDSDRSCGSGARVSNFSLRKPSWLKKKIHYTDENHRVKKILHELGLNTVCKSARCPNLSECFHHRRATFLILGNACTRRCTFCAVEKAASGLVLQLDEEEPLRVREAVRKLGLAYVVITSVTRDDLPDGGAAQFARTIGELRSLELRSTELSFHPGTVKVEVLTPDFLGREESIRTVADAGPDVYNHNVETVPRLYPLVRPGAVYTRSLDLLRFLKHHYPRIFLKSGVMVGMGERTDEVIETLRDLRQTGCDAITIGQYLRPRNWNLPVYEYVSPEVFHYYREQAERLGFLSVASGPYVRSSYMAHEGFEQLAHP